MVDFLTKAQRSERMSRIRGSDTKPEMVLRKFLHAGGFATVCTEQPSRTSLIWFLRNIKPSCLSWVLLASALRLQRRHDAENQHRVWLGKFERNVARD